MSGPWPIGSPAAAAFSRSCRGSRAPCTKPTRLLTGQDVSRCSHSARVSGILSGLCTITRQLLVRNPLRRCETCRHNGLHRLTSSLAVPVMLLRVHTMITRAITLCGLECQRHLGHDINTNMGKSRRTLGKSTKNCWWLLAGGCLHLHLNLNPNWHKASCPFPCHGWQLCFE